jgi:hypothetical protein
LAAEQRDQKAYDDFVNNQERELETAKRYIALGQEEKTADYERQLEALAVQYEAERSLLEDRQMKLQELTAMNNDTRFLEEEQITLAMSELDKEYYDEKEKLEKDAAAAETARNLARLNAASAIAGGMSAILKVVGKEHHNAAVAAKGIDLAQAVINTASGVANALKDGPAPIAIANSIAIGLAGAAQIATIATTPIPSAETGGRFLVPDTFTGVDGAVMRVNQGEVVDVTPRGGSGNAYGEPVHITINLDGRPLVDFFNDKIDSREINITAGLNV